MFHLITSIHSQRKLELVAKVEPQLRQLPDFVDVFIDVSRYPPLEISPGKFEIYSRTEWRIRSSETIHPYFTRGTLQNAKLIKLMKYNPRFSNSPRPFSKIEPLIEYMKERYDARPLPSKSDLLASGQSIERHIDDEVLDLQKNLKIVDDKLNRLMEMVSKLLPEEIQQHHPLPEGEEAPPKRVKIEPE